MAIIKNISETTRREILAMLDRLLATYDFRIDEQVKHLVDKAKRAGMTAGSPMPASIRQANGQLQAYMDRKASLMWLHSIVDNYKVHKSIDDNIYELD